MGAENKRTTQIAKMDAQNVKDTFDEKARVRSRRVAMTRGGPRQRYSGGHNGAAGAEAKAAALAQESGSDASSESDSDEEEVNAQKHQALQQAIANKKNNKPEKKVPILPPTVIVIESHVFINSIKIN